MSSNSSIMASSPPQCRVLATPNTVWNFCPNASAADALCALFAAVIIAHILQGIYYRKPYTWVIAMSAAWQTAAYAFRIVSIAQPANLGPYVGWFVLLLVAPLWTNAFVYMVFGRMVWNYSASGRVGGISATRFGLCFVILDIIAFLVQAYGASQAGSATNNTPVSTIMMNLHIYQGGVAIQQFFILVFLGFAIVFHLRLRKETYLSATERKSALRLLWTLYIVLALISTRIIFRLIEYSHGLTSTIPNHEAFQYCLDTLPMILALLILNVMHPGAIMRGSAYDIPARKERKRLRAEGVTSGLVLRARGGAVGVTEGKVVGAGGESSEVVSNVI